MTPLVVGVIGIIGLVFLLFTGISVGIAMAIVGFVGFAYLAGFDPAFGLLMTVPYSTVASYSMSVVPLFVLMGQFAFHSGISEDLFKTAYKWLGHMPGGLSMASIGASAGFAAICGSSAATTATIGAVSLPEMEKLKYNKAFASACLAAGGTLGILIPPSTGFILYGVIAEKSIGKLFIAGIIPGIILATMYMFAIYFVAKRHPELGPSGAKTTWKEKIYSLKDTWAMLVLFLGIMGGIIFGVFTANEAGAMGAFGALLFLIGKGKFNRKNIINCMTETMNTTAMVFLILVGAYVFSYFLTLSTLPQEIAAFLGGLPVSRYIIIIGIMTIYLGLGCIMDSLSRLSSPHRFFFQLL
jgi:tripartite ATP-independent transporter DctM subunit